jgi:glycosyltransferase involved in cell wall biosynthesis
MKIVLVDLSRRFGGADMRVLQLAARLPAQWDIRVAVLAGSETEARFAREGLKLHRVRAARRNPLTMVKLVRLFRALRPDIVDCHNAQSQLWGLPAARIAGIPARIATMHSIYEQSEGREQIWRIAIYKGLYRLIAAMATQVVSVSETVDKHLAGQGIKTDLRHVIHNGLAPVAGTAAAPGDIDDGGDGAGDGDKFRIAVVGRLAPVKGHRVLLEALAAAHGRFPPLTCHIIGDGPERGGLDARVESLGLGGQVRFTGYRPDVAELVARADVLCMPSLSEGLPFAALEAALLAKPIVASAVGGLKTHFVDGETAILVEPGDPAALADALAWCAENADAAAAIGLAAKSMVEKEFSIDCMIAENCDLYLNAGQSGGLA